MEKRKPRAKGKTNNLGRGNQNKAKESHQLNKDQRDRLDVFQLKGIRQIMKLPTAWGQMQKGEKPTWDTNRIFAVFDAKVNSYEARRNDNGFYKPIKKIIPLEEYYFQLKRKAIICIINEEDEEPTTFSTTNERLKLKTYGFMKWGGPRHNWWQNGS